MKMKTNIRKAWIATLTLDKIDFKTKTLIRDKEGPSNSSAGCWFEETQSTNSERPKHPYVHCSITCDSKEREAT